MTMTNRGATELDAGAEIDVRSGNAGARREVGKTAAPRSSMLVGRSTWEATGAQEGELKKAETPATDLGRQDGAAELTLTEIDAGSGAGHGQRSDGGHRGVGSGRW